MNLNTTVLIQTVFQGLSDPVLFFTAESGGIGKMKNESNLCIDFVYILAARTAAAGEEKLDLARLKILPRKGVFFHFIHLSYLTEGALAGHFDTEDRSRCGRY